MRAVSLGRINKTLDQIRREGLEALRERLGPAGTVRFLQQFQTGSGDYANARHEWVDATPMKSIVAAARKTRKRRK